EPAGGLADDASSDELVRLETLERTALDRQHEPRAPRRDRRGDRPRLIDLDQVGQRLPKQNRRERHGDAGDDDVAEPAPDAGAGLPGAARDRLADLARDGELERRAEHGE